MKHIEYHHFILKIPPKKKLKVEILDSVIPSTKSDACLHSSQELVLQVVRLHSVLVVLLALLNSHNADKCWNIPFSSTLGSKILHSFDIQEVSKC